MWRPFNQVGKGDLHILKDMHEMRKIMKDRTVKVFTLTLFQTQWLLIQIVTDNERPFIDVSAEFRDFIKQVDRTLAIGSIVASYGVERQYRSNFKRWKIAD